MNEKTTLVIGSGISGLTMALLLARAGRNVAIVEKMPFIGGYINRFTRSGFRFDTGLHFTGGFGNSLSQLLELLGLEDDVKPAPMRADVLLADEGLKINIPGTGLGDLADTLAGRFPKYAEAIRAYYAAEQDVVDHTPIFNVAEYTAAKADFVSQLTDYDAMTVQEFFLQHGIDSPELQTILPIMALCHGSPPVETPFPYHCRCAYGLDEGLRTIVHGGDAFLAGFKRQFAKFGVTTYLNTTVTRLEVSETEPICTAVVLSNGERLEVDGVFFAVHPSVYMPLIPERLLTQQFRRRNSCLKPTCSFFSIYGYLDKDFSAPNSLVFFLRQSDISKILMPGNPESHYSTGMVTSNDPMNPSATFTAFRTLFVEDVEKICGVAKDNYRSAYNYLEFKQKYTEAILGDVYSAFPQYKGHLHIADAASPLTCARFSAPTGTAYGTRQLLAQSRTAGRLPVENCYALGHHVQFPGILGCMLGAFNIFTSV